ncbi:DUF2946 domain-containing protein [Shewanella sp. MF05960]|uniref:DUF2946 domain-containing protein n=1 Tax=Shewanella sp. MF05960 TaxID=3434874 RepID=UPI003D7A8F58
MAYHEDNKHFLTLWLIAMVVLLSVASSIHSITHIEDTAKHHSVHCSSLHQLQNVITSTPYIVPVMVQSYVRQQFQLISFTSQFTRFFNTRAPPQTAS